MSTQETQPSFSFMEEEPEHDSKHEPGIQPENSQEAKSSHQIELGSNGEELITKGNLEIAIENMRNNTEEKVLGKLVAFEGRSPGYYTFKRWIKIGHFLQGPESKKTSFPDVVLALLNEDEQRKAFHLLHPEIPITNIPSVELEPVDSYPKPSQSPEVETEKENPDEDDYDDDRSYIPGRGYV